MKAKSTTTMLLDERDALQLYCEALLREVPEELPEEQAADVEATPATTAPPADGPKDAIPDWGRGRFQALLFRAGNITLAVPLAGLAGVEVWGAQRVTPLPSRVEWLLGLITYRGRNVPVADTACLVLPRERRARLVEPQRRISHVLFIDDGSWGLACEGVTEVIRLEGEAVRWRARTTHPWFAGTVVERMCVLIDPRAFVRVLQSGAPFGLESGVRS